MSMEKPKEPTEKLKEKHVRIIYVPVDVVVRDAARRAAMGDARADTATLADVAKHIGTPAPTDIVVFNKQPYHFAGVGADKRLREHPQVHIDFPETVLVLKPGEQAVWTSDRSFEITRAVPSGGHGGPNFPEIGTPEPYPFPNQPIRADLRPAGQWIAESGAPKPGARAHMYKISFTIETDDVDPDVYCSSN